MKTGRMIKSWPRSLLLKSPYSCNIKVTTRCNLKCGFCGLWSLPVTYELTLDDYRYIADLLRKIGMARVVITGGEPLLRQDTPEIINLFARRGISTTLLTNGTLLTRAGLKKLLNMGLNDIGISLDSLDKKSLESVCGKKGIWDKIVESILMASEMTSHGLVEVLTTVTGNNLEEIPDLIQYVCDELGAWSVINPVNIPPNPDAILSADANDIAPPYPPKTVDNVYQQIFDMKASGKNILVSDRFLHDSIEYLKTGKFKWKCDAGERYFTIFPDGGLAPCSDQPAVAGIMNMKPADFRNREYKRTVRKVQKSCGGCIFSCWRELSYLFNDVSAQTERMKSIRGLFNKR